MPPGFDFALQLHIIRLSDISFIQGNKSDKTDNNCLNPILIVDKCRIHNLLAMTLCTDQKICTLYIPHLSCLSLTESINNHVVQKITNMFLYYNGATIKQDLHHLNLFLGYDNNLFQITTSYVFKSD